MLAIPPAALGHSIKTHLSKSVKVTLMQSLEGELSHDTDVTLLDKT
jgi:hypothetical protein